MATAITLKNLRKEYGAHVAIEDLSLEIKEGEFFTLLGPSGCGKTTLLRMIAGFNSIEGGTIDFNGKVINDLAPGSRNIGMVFQNYALFPQMSAGKNVAFGLENRKVPKGEIKQRVESALGDVHMTQYVDRMPGNMSGGQQQRVALARAMVISPDVLLMDEPLSNLDAKLRVEMRETIRRVQLESHITTVYVTHDQEEAMAVSDRIAVMSEGVVQQVDTPEAIYHRPANLFVADFIGKANKLHRSMVVEGGRKLVKISDAHVLDVTDFVATEAVAGDIVLSIRPEGARVADAGIPGEVVLRTFLGSHTQYQVRIPGGDVVEVSEADGLGDSRQVGESLFLEIDVDRVNVFDAASTTSIMRGVDTYDSAEH